MKSLRTVLIGLAVIGMFIFLTNVSSAEEECGSGKSYHESRIKLMKDSAAALEKTNPDLAKQLSNCADEATKKMEERKIKHDAKIKVLKDSAAALEKSNPDLAKGLEEMAAAKPMKEMHKMMQEKNEKEEAGEKVEPKSEKGETK